MLEPQDLGFTYNKALEEPDGHILEFLWMDMSGASGTTGETT